MVVAGGAGVTVAAEDGFSIDCDPSRRLVRVTLRGFWNAGTVDRYDRALHATGERMHAAGVRRTDLLALVDARALGAQSRELVDSYRERFDHPERRPRRLATLVSSALLRMQVQRIGMPNQRLFEDERAALAWLLD